MPTQHCTCGAKYRFGDAAIGKRAKCKKCGTILTLTGDDDLGPIPLADDGMMDEMAAAAERARTVPVSNTGSSGGGNPVPSSFLPSAESAGRLGPVVIEEAKRRGFLQDVVRAVVFPISIGNGMTFVILWVVIYISTVFLGSPNIGIGPISILRFLFYIAAVGWWTAFRFNTIGSAAGGEHDLPKLSGVNDFWEDLFLPFFQWIGSWIVVLLPALAYWIAASALGWVSTLSGLALLEDGLAGIFKNVDASTAPIVGLVVLGLFWWPIVALCVALGGFGCLARLDLLVTTVTRTLPFYAVVVFLVFSAAGTSVAISTLIAERFDPGEGAPLGSMFGAWLVIQFLAMGVQMYFDLVAMQVIGFYYHHYKDRFAWDWG